MTPSVFSTCPRPVYAVMQADPRALFPAAFLAVLLAAASPARAQTQTSSFGSTLEAVGEEYARLYAQPVVDAVGANLNSGFFYDAGVEQNGLVPGVNLYVGVKAFATSVPDSDRSLSLRYSVRESITLDRRNANGELTRCTSRGKVMYTIDDAPTAFGSDEAGEIRANNGNSVTFQCNDGTEVTRDGVSQDLLPGLNMGTAPLAVPQVGVGLPYTGTRLSLRLIPNLRYRDYGTIEFFGGGVRQEITRFLPMLPLDLSAHLFYQSISVEEEILGAEGTEFVSASTWAGGLSASKTLSVVTFYGGLQFERTNANLNYTFVPGAGLEARTIDLDFSGANSFRVLAGASLGLGPVVLNVDVSQGQRSVLSAGLGFQL
ncbi:MAG: hypothetical protein BRD52_07035 [Bacteroidetes bacterium SW_4_67_19]|nr:MAG: hypothetical protein BRD52_07035 [Bacteroidetes bacterium SW_4_67_19]